MYDNANEPAMPIFDDAVESYSRKIYLGLTKREMFAMAAMQGLCHATNSEGVWQHDSKTVAVVAVKYADALLAKLEK